jgi:hypothetical protein
MGTLSMQKTLFLSLLFFSSISLASPPLPHLAGTYQFKNPICSVLGAPNEKGEREWETCSSHTLDCLSLEPISKTEMKVTVESFQTNMHECSASGIAKLKSPGHLVISKKDLNEGEILEGNSSVDIHYTDSSITITGPSELCGVRASWGLEFGSNTRVTPSAVQCFEPYVRSSSTEPKKLKHKKAKSKIETATEVLPITTYAPGVCQLTKIVEQIQMASLMTKSPDLSLVGEEKLRWISLSEYRDPSGVFYGQTALANLHDTVVWVRQLNIAAEEKWYGPFSFNIKDLKGCVPTSIFW